MARLRADAVFEKPYARAARAATGRWRSNLATSVLLTGRNELEVCRRHLLEERFVLVLRQRPQHRSGLSAGVPVLAAADPNSAGKGSVKAGEEFLGRCDGRGRGGATGARLGDQPHDAA